MIRQIPNILTFSRVLILPILVASIYFENSKTHIVSATIFTIASATDWLDGMLARHCKAESHLGRVLDPISDKMLVITTLVMLVYLKRAPIVPTLIIINRELLISGIREYLSEFHISIPVSKSAKLKTALQFCAIISILLGEPILGSHFTILMGQGGLWMVAAITLYTGASYCREGIKHFSNRDIKQIDN